MNIFRRQESKPKRLPWPHTPACSYCAMPGPYRCEIASCGAPLCLKHRVRKAGGNLCRKHSDAVLQQDDAEPQSRFGDTGEAVPHEESENAKELRRIKDNDEHFMDSIRKKEE